MEWVLMEERTIMRKKYRYTKGGLIEIKRFCYSREDTIQPGKYKIVTRYCQDFYGQMSAEGPVYEIAGPLPHRGKYTITEKELLPLLEPPVYKNSKIMQMQHDKTKETFCLEELVNKVIALHKNTPAGIIRDSDTVLSDLILNADFEVTGISLELMETWYRSSDRASIEALFLIFTDMPFEEYLQRCIHLTSR